MKKIIIFICCLSVSGYLFSQTEKHKDLETLDTVFIDSKTPLASVNSGRVIVKITSEEIKQKSGKSIAQLINEVSGIEINGSRGNEGQNLGYFVRGGRNRQVVIMVDGVQLTDPSQIANDYDLRWISPNNVEEIEIIKGASSVLYGTGAGTAVISITTKSSSYNKFNVSIGSYLGTHRAANDEDNDIEEFTNAVSINGTLSKFSYQMNFNNHHTNGLSAISSPEGEENFEEDVFDRFDGTFKLGYQFNNKINLIRFFSFNKIKSGFDEFSYNDADHLSTNKQLRMGGQFKWKYKKGQLIVNDSHSWIDRGVESFFPTQFDSQNSAFDAFASFRVANELTVLGGLNGQISRFNSFIIPFGETEFVNSIDEETAHFEIIDPYFNMVYKSDFGLNVNAGIRLNNHSSYGNHFVYQINPSYVVKFEKFNMKLMGSYSTAYITPSLYQLYEPSFGNDELEPEENTTIEGGIEINSEGKIKISAVYFSRSEKNLVDFVVIDPDMFLYQFRNINDKFNASGLEIELAAIVGANAVLKANYTNTKTDERFTLRIPEHKVNVHFSYKANERINLGMGYQFVSDREDSFFNPDNFEQEYITLKNYNTFDLNVGYQVLNHLHLYAQVNNILDEEYEELYRFQTLGRNFRIGFNLEL